MSFVRIGRVAIHSSSLSLNCLNLSLSLNLSLNCLSLNCLGWAEGLWVVVLICCG